MKQDYLSRLARAARWYLPPAEAAEVLEDYRDLIEQEPRSEEDLRRDIGTPKDAIEQLVQLKAYHRWLITFTVLAVCVPVPMLMARNGVFWNQLINPAYITVLCLGTALSFLWFQRNGTRGGRLPRTVAVLLALILLGMAWVWFLAGIVLAESWELLNAISSSLIAPRAIHLFLVIEILAMGMASLFGLVRARLGDRRWRAVYVLGLSGVILGLSFYLLLTSLSLDWSTPGWAAPIVIRYLFITAVGLVGTGVSLC